MFYDNLSDEVEHYKSEYFDTFTTESYNIIVCIENYDDEPFWKFIFSEIEGLKPFFHNLDGKNNILKFKDLFDNEFLGCVDSDYDYILNKEYLSNPYIFHTYVYAIENYCICPKSLNSLVDRLNLNCPINFESLFEKLTPILNQVFLYDIYLMDKGEASIRDFFKFNSISQENINEEYIINYFSEKLSEIEVLDDLTLYQEKLIVDTNIDEKNILLYIEGHIIFDSVLNLLEKLQNNNIHSKIKSIGSSTDYTGEEKKIKINELKNKKFDIKSNLRINYDRCFYTQTCPSFNQIILDIQNQELV